LRALLDQMEALMTPPGRRGYAKCPRKIARPM
jgi:hypothetical protein